MGSLRWGSARAGWLCAIRPVAAAALAATTVLIVPGARAGGLLVTDGSAVLQYNATTGAYLNTFAPGSSGGSGSPEAMALRPDGTLYVSAFSFNSVLSFDAQTGAALGPFVL